MPDMTDTPSSASVPDTAGLALILVDAYAIAAARLGQGPLPIGQVMGVARGLHPGFNPDAIGRAAGYPGLRRALFEDPDLRSRIRASEDAQGNLHLEPAGPVQIKPMDVGQALSAAFDAAADANGNALASRVAMHLYRLLPGFRPEEAGFKGFRHMLREDSRFALTDSYPDAVIRLT